MRAPPTSPLRTIVLQVTDGAAWFVPRAEAKPNSVQVAVWRWCKRHDHVMRSCTGAAGITLQVMPRPVPAATSTSTPSTEEKPCTAPNT